MVLEMEVLGGPYEGFLLSVVMELIALKLSSCRFLVILYS